MGANAQHCTYQTRARAREVWGLLQCAVEHIQEDSCATSAFGCRQEVDFSRHCRQGLQAKNLTRSVAPEVIVIDDGELVFITETWSNEVQ